MKQKSFIFSNEESANIITTKILLVSILAFPALIILGLLGIFEFDMPKLFVFCAIGAIGASSPFILRKVGLRSTYLKYFTIFMSTVVVGVLNLNYQIGIYMIFMFPIALSCLYFDKKLTLTALFLGILSMSITNYFRIPQDPKYAYDPFKIYIAITMGYIIEFLILSAIFAMLSKRTRTLLESLSDSEEQNAILNKLKDIMNRSQNASTVLATSVNQLQWKKPPQRMTKSLVTLIVLL